MIIKHGAVALGHEKGDEYLREASSLICKFFSNSIVFRIGGDEFAIILEGEDFNNRLDITKKFNSLMENNIKETNHVLIALGIADYDESNDKSYQSVFERADKTMYQRKYEQKRLNKTFPIKYTIQP